MPPTRAENKRNVRFTKVQSETRIPRKNEAGQGMGIGMGGVSTFGLGEEHRHRGHIGARHSDANTAKRGRRTKNGARGKGSACRYIQRSLQVA